LASVTRVEIYPGPLAITSSSGNTDVLGMMIAEYPIRTDPRCQSRCSDVPGAWQSTLLVKPWPVDRVNQERSREFLRFGECLDMKIENDKTVFFEYVLRDASGHVIESTEEGKPAKYLHGHSPLLSVMKSELEGKCAGDELKIEISPENGHGYWNEEKVQVVPRADLSNLPDIKVGMQLTAKVNDQAIPVMIIEVTDESVTLDGNHPLAGKDLVYEIKIVSVRDATAEELEHHHAHPPGGERG
jgi:FKBP-type peptidyl-prolyl cis-trans isomerase SlyD